MTSAIEPTTLTLENLQKRYPNGMEAIRGISLEVKPGEVFGLVGPNGAGKSTLLKLATGLLYPQAGRVLYNGSEVTCRPKQAARFAGLMPDPLGVYTDVTAQEYLEFFARAQGLPAGERPERIRSAVDMLGLAPWLDAEVETLSAGWQRRLALARVLMANTPVLLLDEPAAGLDVYARSELLSIVKQLAASGRTIMISSHILPELEQLADRFGIINRGQWVEIATGKTFFVQEDLARGLGEDRWQIRCTRAAEAAERIVAAGLQVLETRADGVSFLASDDAAAAAALRAVVGLGAEVYEFKRIQTGLSELVLGVYRKETGAS